MKKPTLHIRLPQRADAVEGEEQRPEKTLPLKTEPDPRTESQAPIQKAGKLLKAENGIIAELDHGPLGA